MGSRPFLEGSPPSAARLRSTRRLLLIAGAVYLAWWFVVEAVVPGSYNALPGRLVVVGSFFVALAGSYGSERVARHIDDAFAACAWLLTAHYYYLVHRNQGDTPWAVGAYVVVFAVAACLTSRRALLAYSVVTLALGVVVSLVDRALLRTIFLPGLATMTLLSNLTLHNRLRLEDERSERTRIDAARAAAEAGVALRDEFIAVASHELRTPLAALHLAVQGLARAARRGDGALDPRAIERTIDTCQRQAARLTRLVAALLDASAIAGGAYELHLERVVLVDLVRDVAEVLASDAERAGSRVEITGDTAVRGRWDRTRLEQVVTNVLRNAIVFGLGRPIRIAVTAEGDFARLTIADQGIGVAPEEHERIFGRFERAVPTRNYGGMGLGLHIARRIVDAHRGRLRVESELGRGATFVVELPMTAV